MPLFRKGAQNSSSRSDRRRPHKLSRESAGLLEITRTCSFVSSRSPALLFSSVHQQEPFHSLISVVIFPFCTTRAKAATRSLLLSFRRRRLVALWRRRKAPPRNLLCFSGVFSFRLWLSGKWKKIRKNDHYLLPRKMLNNSNDFSPRQKAKKRTLNRCRCCPALAQNRLLLL